MIGKDFSFKVIKRDAEARSGIITTPRGEILTPVFMPVGTAASVKTLTALELRDCRVQILLGNTYHLHQFPGEDIIAELGGLAHFMAWDKATLTDSGGFQVFSLSDTRTVKEWGVEFRSVFDGSLWVFTPESVYNIQQKIGADFIVALDECPPYPAAESAVSNAVRLSSKWAKVFMEIWQGQNGKNNVNQAPFLVVQGGLFPELRTRSVEELTELESFGFGIGGLSVGEPQSAMIETAQLCCELLPEAKPRHLMGVGTPIDIIEAIGVGVDMFDCVMPTRNGRNAQAFTWNGVVNLRNSSHRRDQNPIDRNCECIACSTYSRAYLHHLFNAGEILGLRLTSFHNVYFYARLLEEARKSIVSGNFSKWRSETIDKMVNIT